jgi:hypothetical protein
VISTVKSPNPEEPEPYNGIALADKTNADMLLGLILIVTV